MDNEMKIQNARNAVANGLAALEYAIDNKHKEGLRPYDDVDLARLYLSIALKWLDLIR